MRATIARHSFTCTKCGGAIIPGERIEYDKARGIRHCEHCINTQDLVKARKRQGRMLAAMGLI